MEVEHQLQTYQNFGTSKVTNFKLMCKGVNLESTQWEQRSEENDVA